MTEEQWRAISEHDASYDGKFFFGLKTKKTICRPSCRVRKCEISNIVIFNSCKDGIEAGCMGTACFVKGSKELLERAKEKLNLEEGQTSEDGKFSLDTIANALFLNKIYLAKCFKSTTGETLLKYLNRVRCREASKLLKETDLSIELIGNKVGYETASHFVHKFKGFYKCTPLQYRKTTTT